MAGGIGPSAGRRLESSSLAGTDQIIREIERSHRPVTIRPEQPARRAISADRTLSLSLSLRMLFNVYV